MSWTVDDARRGTAYGAGAYLLWGLFPLYFRLLLPAGAVEILVHRVAWSLLVCLVLAAVLRDISWVRPLLAAPRRLVPLAVAAGFIALNWGVYIHGVNSGQVVESALGYFISPLLTVLLGVFLLRERLRRLQWAALALGALAVVVLAVDFGRPPWLALLIAGSFAIYGLMKKQVGADLGALGSLTAETAILFPFAIGALVWLEATGRGTVSEQAPSHALFLASAGVVTVIPLLLFAASARRVSLSTIGLLQFSTPVLQLLVAVLLLGERVPPSRWVGFSIVWLALIALGVDLVRSARASRAVALPAEVTAEAKA